MSKTITPKVQGRGQNPKMVTIYSAKGAGPDTKWVRRHKEAKPQESK